MKYQTRRGMSSSRSQRREAWIDVQPIVKVGPEAAFFHRLLQILVGRGNHADIHLARVRRADPLELAFLQHPEKLRPNFGRQVAVSSRKWYAVRDLEAALAGGYGAGEGTPPWPNSSDSMSVDGSAAVHPHEGSRPCALRV